MAVTNWVKASVGLATFGFINLVLFIVLSAPFGDLVDTISEESADLGVDSDVDPFLDIWRTIFGVSFVLSMFGLAVWFFLGTHREEFEQH